MSPPNTGTTRLFSAPLLSVNVLLMQMNALPPFDIVAPVRKSTWPPVPLICRVPLLSELTCPYKSTPTQLLSEMKLSSCAITFGSFT